MLSEEERALWESVAKQIKPLRKKSRAAKAARRSSRTPERAGRRQAGRRHRGRIVAGSRAASRPSRPSPPLAPLGRRERSQLSRGTSEIDARLDLHGMTQVRAHHALLGFLQRAHTMA